ncbi:MAG: NAD+ synthase [Endomicrobiaceae bacterium]|nr:NAD+ synthase [Endomicrobiaceae bacterium]
MKIALARINQTTGNIEKNTEKIIGFVQKAAEQKADIAVFPEFAVTGGYVNDLLNQKDFIMTELKAVENIANKASVNIVLGTISTDKTSKELINSVTFINDLKQITTVSSKSTLNDGYFNDLKYFKKSDFITVFKVCNKNISCVIADSLNSVSENIKKAADIGADIVIVLSCSPYYKWKEKEIKNTIKESAKENSVDVAYINMLGGNDGYVFDGQALYVDKEGGFKTAGMSFNEELIVVDTDDNRNIESSKNNEAKELYDVLVLGLRDYIKKNNFKKCALGISGGIDSALTLAIAVDAIGAENVLGVLMPSKYTSKESIDCGLELCNNLKVQTKIISIKDIYDVYINQLTPFFDGKPKDLTEENLQARIRSNILMALSNKFSYFILCTCNKSEDAVGYSTLYGDATGGYSVIGDLLKKEVYELSRYRNTVSKAIPEFIITRPPTAELRENQKDSDSLPEYDILDDIIIKILDKKMTYSQIIESGVKKEVLDKVWKLLSVSEYKRRQSPVGIKVSKSAFLRDINFPMSNGYIWKPANKKDLC